MNRLLRIYASTDTDYAPWYLVPSDDKRRARLNCSCYQFSLVPYQEQPRIRIKLGKRSRKDTYKTGPHLTRGVLCRRNIQRLPGHSLFLEQDQ